MEKKKIPEFASEAEEARFWDTHSIEDFADDLEDAPPIKISPDARTQPISLRLSIKTLTALKRVATAQGIGYQSLMKQWIEDRLKTEDQPKRRQLKELVRKAQGELLQIQDSLEEIKKRA